MVVKTFRIPDLLRADFGSPDESRGDISDYAGLNTLKSK